MIAVAEKIVIKVPGTKLTWPPRSGNKNSRALDLGSAELVPDEHHVMAVFDDTCGNLIMIQSDSTPTE